MNVVEMNLPDGWRVVGPLEDDDCLYLLRRDGVSLATIRFLTRDGGVSGRFSWAGTRAAGDLAPYSEGGFSTIEKAAQMAVRILMGVPIAEATV